MRNLTKTVGIIVAGLFTSNWLYLIEWVLLAVMVFGSGLVNALLKSSLDHED